MERVRDAVDWLLGASVVYMMCVGVVLMVCVVMRWIDGVVGGKWDVLAMNGADAFGGGVLVFVMCCGFMVLTEGEGEDIKQDEE